MNTSTPMKTLVVAVVASAATLVGCSTLNGPVPSDYMGPVAYLTDTAEPYDRTKGRFFVLAEVDGTPVNNAMYEPHRAGSGPGFALTTLHHNRSVPVRTMSVKLIGRHLSAAPIYELASRAAGTFVSVEGVVAFTPKVNGNYRVNGLLLKDCPAVWIEDANTKETVTDVVRPKPCT